MAPARSLPPRSCAAPLGNIAHVGATLPSGSDGQSFLWEVVPTFFLMLVVMAVATDTRAVGEAAAIAIGSTVGLDAMFGGPISGASMNPARSLGPAVVSGDLHALWIYLTAPILGAILSPTSSCAARRRAQPSCTPPRSQRERPLRLRREQRTLPNERALAPPRG
jgi:aquaporin NIP